MFEYGSGASTAFFAGLIDSVISCEYDKEWYDFVLKTAPHNAKIIYIAEDEDGDYCRTIHTTDLTFDLILIDGRDRLNCIEQSIDRLTDRGVILLDDTHRPAYQVGFEALHKRGFRSLTFEGLKPLAKKMHSTTIFYRDRNCLGI